MRRRSLLLCFGVLGPFLGPSLGPAAFAQPFPYCEPGQYLNFVCADSH